MKTSKPISTISYNTKEYLENIIQYWKNEGLIEFAMWIRHEPEPDEEEKKAHYHVFIKPAKLIQTVDLENQSKEFDPTNPKKPLKMISFRSSKESDWVLYGIHDKLYLAEKGLERSFHYDLQDINATCEDTLTDIISHLNDERKGRIEYRIMDCCNRGMTWGQIVASGLVPLRYMTGARIMYKALTGCSDLD